MDISNVLIYLSGFIILAGIYGIFSLGLNVHWGFTGLFNIGVAGFFALGAYTAAILTSQTPDPQLFEDHLFGGNLAQLLDFGFDFWFFVGLAASAIVCAVAALIVGVITLRLRDDYLAISTLGIAEGVRLTFLNESWLANGNRGLYRIPKFLGDLVSPSNYDLLYALTVLLVLAVLYFIIQRAVNSPWGRVLRAIREDEMTAAASGKNVARFKIEAFMLGAAVMGVGGAVYTHGVRFIDPFAFEPFMGTFVIWVMLIIGGSGRNIGAILGAFIVWGIWSGTQFIPGSGGEARFLHFDLANIRYFLIGALLIITILIKPDGVIGEFARIHTAIRRLRYRNLEHNPEED